MNAPDRIVTRPAAADAGAAGRATGFLATQGARLCLGSVGHARPPRGGKPGNRFRYAHFTLCLPLSTLADLRVRGLGIERHRPVSFFARDHGPRDGSALLPWMRDILQRHDLACADGEIILQTMPRLFGYVFNPVSFWYCLDRSGALRAVLCEVSNTFGEHHNYLVAHADGRPIANDDVLETRKAFHVSPFFAVQGEYRFRFSRLGDQRTVVIDYWSADELQLHTQMTGRERPLSGAALAAALLRCPLLTFNVVFRIHWQAVRLLFKRIPFFRKPPAPQESLT